MEPNELTERMISELRTLLAEMEAGNRTSNPDLEALLRTCVRHQMNQRRANITA